MPDLFEPLVLKSLTLRNRIAVPAMCQYSAIDGVINDWHLGHYAGLARGGAGLVIVEAAAVSPEGRITPGCAGIWNKRQALALAPVAEMIKAAGAVPGIQIGHAGRKASANRPWEGDDHISSDDPAGWETLSPSAIPLGGKLSKVPKAMTAADIARVKDDFAGAAERALDAGFEWLELHFAHGYLGQSFFSKHANGRTDAYGGNFENRSRFLLETLAAVRRIWPEEFPLTGRFGVIEYDGNDEETLSESIELVKAFKREGLDLLNVSIGFSTPNVKIPWAPGFLAPIAAQVKHEADIPVASSWYFDNPQVAQQAIANCQVDLVMVGRAHLANPHWPFWAAKQLNRNHSVRTLPIHYAHWLERYQAE
jgi:2,4-dienoyl-CoA reductase-like NADH-dependent reductase (Old Yellow Enzyme family)